jgi:protein-S-isoprenylcysteine O-methyltransferase Ste14
LSIINPFALFCALCITSYWAVVVFKVIRMTAKIGKTPNVVPKESLGYLSRAIMLPLIILWIILPWQAAFSSAIVSSKLACLGSIFCFMGFGFTLYCWHYMGTSWRIGIDPKEKNQLITDGPFKHIRHPIYALSMLLMLGSLLCLQSAAILVLFCVHWVIFTLEALREERYLSGIYGETYQHYMNQTNRFLPRV